MSDTNPLEGKSVLLVDDEPDVLDTLEDLLPMCQTARASDFKAAKDLLEGQPPLVQDRKVLAGHPGGVRPVDPARARSARARTRRSRRARSPTSRVAFRSGGSFGWQRDPNREDRRMYRALRRRRLLAGVEVPHREYRVVAGEAGPALEPVLGWLRLRFDPAS